ncbi:MAG: hypothetical protein COA78_24570 [Blastopirellula sp.]|nr:MAG: hypothetical protein COA78_24570 [Blastopirellula sp.]
MENKKKDFNRRDFNRLTAAALGGLMTGTAIGCGGGDDPGTNGNGTPDPVEAPPFDPTAGGDGTSTDVAMAGNHACRGLNECKGKGVGGENDCAGAGACATTKAHACHAENDCKLQGGCGSTPGANECKGKGECAVPIKSQATWDKARELFEARMKTAEKTVMAAPETPAKEEAPAEEEAAE